MADINGIVTIGASETPGQATVLLFNETGDTIVASTTSHPSTGAYAFTGLPGGTVYRVVVLGNGTYRTRAYGPCTTAVADDYSVNYSSLLHFDGADASTTFTDQGGTTWTANGAAQIDTAQSKFGGASGLFDGTGAYLQCSPTGLHQFDGGDFTVEAWVRLSTSPGAGAYRFLVARDDVTAANGGRDWAFLVDGDVGGKLKFGIRVSTTAYVVTANNAFPTNVWCHVAAVRNGGNLMLFVNGALENTVAISGVANNNSHATQIGAVKSGAATTGYWDGHVDDLRITKGKALYTANFTPPTQAHTNGRTVSLLHFDGADASTTFTDQTGKTWAANGNAQIDTAQSKFGGASLLLDGNGDYASTPHHADFEFGSGDFTLEGWVRPTSVSTGWVINKRTTPAHWVPWGVLLDPSNYLRIVCSDLTNAAYETDFLSTVAVAVNTWTHWALVRNGNTFTIFVNGVASGSATRTSALRTSTGEAVCIGASSASATPASMFSGWMDDMRITKGVARYTANFTPPTAAFSNP